MLPSQVLERRKWNNSKHFVSSFCSDQHRALHEDGGQCLPFLVTSRAGVGRCVMAARDIAPGQLIFREEAVAIGPNHDTPPLCLSCLKVVNNHYHDDATKTVNLKN